MDHVFEKLDRIVAFRIPFGGYELEIGNTIVVSWMVMAIIIIAAVIFTRTLSIGRPGRLQCLAEMGVEFITRLCQNSIGHHGKTFVPYIGTLLIYLITANIIAVFNFIPGISLFPPTKDINVTGALSVISILTVLCAGFRYKGLGGWAKSLTDPMPVIAPFKILEYITKPLSLCLRLFGNILAGFIIMELVLAFIPYAAMPISLYFDWFDGILQAYIFVYLTAVYVGEAVE